MTVPSTPQLQHQLHHDLSVPETTKLDAVEEMIYQVSVEAESEKDKQQYQKEPANAAATLMGTLQSSASPTFTVGIHLMDGVHVPVPADGKEHRITQAYTETEVPVPGEDGKEATEVRRVWEERVDDGEWTVVREEKAVLVEGKEA